MKKIILGVAVLFCYTQSAWGQYFNFEHDQKEFYAFTKTTLAVVRSGDQEFDDYLEEIMNEYWTITPFVMIDSEAIDDYYEKKYFIMLTLSIELNSVHAEELVIIPKGPTIVNGIAYYNNIFAGMHIDTEIERSPEQLMFRLPFIIKTLHDLLLFAAGDDVSYKKMDFTNSYEDAMAFLNHDAWRVSKLKVLIPEEIYDYQRPASLAKHIGNKEHIIERDALEEFPFKYEIKPWNEILAIVNDSTLAGKYCLYTPIMVSSTTNSVIYDLETGSTILYYSSDRVSVDKLQMKRITEVIEDSLKEKESGKKN